MGHVMLIFDVATFFMWKRFDVRDQLGLYKQ